MIIFINIRKSTEIKLNCFGGLEDVIPPTVGAGITSKMAGGMANRGTNNEKFNYVTN